MERTEGFGCGMKDQKCSFCCAPSGQIRLILRTVLRQMSRMLEEKKYGDMLAGSQENSGALCRLMRVVFSQHQFQLKLSKGCPHLRLCNLIRQRLGCRSDQLEFIIEDLCDRIARRHYELEIIASQIKNLENSITDFEEPFSASSSKKSSSHNEHSIKEQPGQLLKQEEGAVSVQLEPKPEPEAEVEPEAAAEVKVKIEELELGANLEGSPPTVTPYVSFGQMPYSQFFLFYGPCYL